MENFLLNDFSIGDIVSAQDILFGRCSKSEDFIGKEGLFLNNIPKTDPFVPIEIPRGFLKDVCLSSDYPFKTEDSEWVYFIPYSFTYEDKQNDWVRHNDLKPGDRVLIERGFEAGENGFNYSMDEEGFMKASIGSYAIVEDIYSDAIALFSGEKGPVDTWEWPYFCLRKVTLKDFDPFDLSNKRDRDFLRGKWIRNLKYGTEKMITVFFPNGSVGGFSEWNIDNLTGKTLLEEWEFVGSKLPCGKPKEIIIPYER